MKNRLLHGFVLLVFGIFLTCSFNLAQEKADEELKKEFAPILGEYAFDWNGQTFTLNFYVEGGALWADSGDGRPVTMKPALENTFEFVAEDPINGTFQFKFSKDDQGKYSACQVVNSGMGLDVQEKRKNYKSALTYLYSKDMSAVRRILLTNKWKNKPPQEVA